LGGFPVLARKACAKNAIRIAKGHSFGFNAVTAGVKVGTILACEVSCRLGASADDPMTLQGWWSKT